MRFEGFLGTLVGRGWEQRPYRSTDSTPKWGAGPAPS